MRPSAIFAATLLFVQGCYYQQMTWQPGESGNLAGKPVGTLSAKTRALREKIDGIADSRVLLAEVVASDGAPLEKRIAAAAALIRFQHAPAPRLIKKALDLPEPATVEDALRNLARIATAAARRRIGLDEARDLSALQQNFIDCVVDVRLEQHLAEIEQALQNPDRRPTIVVSGGLPRLPLGPGDGELIYPHDPPPPKPVLVPPDDNGGAA